MNRRDFLKRAGVALAGFHTRNLAANLHLYKPLDFGPLFPARSALTNPLELMRKLKSTP